MMKIKLLFTVLLIGCVYSHAQDISIQAANIEFDYSNRDCWQTKIVGKSNDVKRAWKRFLKTEFDVKLKGFGLFSNKDVLSAEETEITTVSSKLINFYTHFKGKKNPIMKVFASYAGDESNFINNNSSEFEKLKEKVIIKFINSYYPKYYNNRVDNTIKKIEKLTKNIKRDKDKITELEKKIKSLKEQIVNNEKSLTTSKEQLEIRRKELDTIKNVLKNL